MDWDIRIGDRIKTDHTKRGISEVGVVDKFDDPDDDGELYACFVNHTNLDTGAVMPMFVLIAHITNNLSANERDQYFHDSIKLLESL